MRLLRNDQSLLITHKITHKHTKTEPELAAMVTDSSVVFYGYSKAILVFSSTYNNNVQNKWQVRDILGSP